MRPRHRVSRAAIELIKQFEGYRAQAAQLPDGRWTIGYGHTVTARAGAQVSEDDAEALLIWDLIAVSHVVNENVFAPLTQNQFDALLSFAFNLGADAFRQSQVLKRLNEGQVVQAACAMELWRKAEFQGQRIVIDALVRRRAAEKALFLTPPDAAWVAAPSPVLRPLVDADARELIPAEKPAEVVTSLEGERVEVAREDAPAAPMAALEPVVEEPGETLRTAAEQVSARLQTIMADFGDEPLATETRPQADFAPPITPVLEEAEAPDPATESDDTPAEESAEPETSLEEPFPEEMLDDQAAFDLPPPPVVANDLETDLRAAVALGPKVVIDDVGAYEFIPARVQPLPRKKEPSVALDIVLGLLGLAFFSFGVVWGASAQPNPSGGPVSPWMVAATAGFAGVGFVFVAVLRLLQRIQRAAERD